jgi:hypothetical protein
MPKVFVAYGCATEERTSSIFPGECCACASARCNLRSLPWIVCASKECMELCAGFWLDVNGLSGDKLHVQREFPPHLVPGKASTSCRLLAMPIPRRFCKSAKCTARATLMLGYQEMVGAQEATSIPRCAKWDRGRVFDRTLLRSIGS